VDAGSQLGNAHEGVGGESASPHPAGPTTTAGLLASLGAGDGIGWAVAAGLAVAAVFVPGVLRGALFVVAGVVALATGSPRWFGVLLVTAGVPILLLVLVSRSYWFG